MPLLWHSCHSVYFTCTYSCVGVNAAHEKVYVYVYNVMIEHVLECVIHCMYIHMHELVTLAHVYYHSTMFDNIHLYTRTMRLNCTVHKTCIKTIQCTCMYCTCTIYACTCTGVCWSYSRSVVGVPATAPPRASTYMYIYVHSAHVHVRTCVCTYQVSGILIMLFVVN